MIEVITQYGVVGRADGAGHYPAYRDAIQGMSGLTEIRSLSIFGLSDVKVYFDFDTDYFRDRQEILNRLQLVTEPISVFRRR